MWTWPQWLIQKVVLEHVGTTSCPIKRESFNFGLRSSHQIPPQFSWRSLWTYCLWQFMGPCSTLHMHQFSFTKSQIVVHAHRNDDFFGPSNWWWSTSTSDIACVLGGTGVLNIRSNDWVCVCVWPQYYKLFPYFSFGNIPLHFKQGAIPLVTGGWPTKSCKRTCWQFLGASMRSWNVKEVNNICKYICTYLGEIDQF